jgi:hypothetical protein
MLSSSKYEYYDVCGVRLGDAGDAVRCGRGRNGVARDSPLSSSRLAPPALVLFPTVKWLELEMRGLACSWFSG